MPEVTQKKPVYKKWWFWVLAVFTLIVVSAAFDGANDPTTNTRQASQLVAPIVDGEHLLGLTIDQAREELGAPDEDEFVDPSKEQLALGTKTWTNQYTIIDHTIVLDFDVTSRQVTGFFISMNEKEGVTRDWKALAQLGGLSEDATGYSIKPVESLKDPGYYTGVQAAE